MGMWYFVTAWRAMGLQFDSYRIRFEKMRAMGPNDLNLINYVQGEPNEGQSSSRMHDNEEQLEQIERQFDVYVRSIRKQEQILAKVAKSIDEANGQQYFITEFYPEFALDCTYVDDTEKRTIASSNFQIAKVLDNLERNNKVLKEEMKGWLFEYAKKTKLSEALIVENKLLRKYVKNKNKDIVKLISTITNAQNEELTLLNENLSELKQENGVLVDHLKKIKDALRDTEDKEKRIKQAYQRAEREKMELQAKIQAAEDEEEHYSKMISLLEGTFEDVSKRQRRLQEQKQRLLKIKIQYQQDQVEIERQIDQCKIDRQDIEKHLIAKHKGYQTEKQRLCFQMDDLNESMKRIKDQTRAHEEQIARYEHKIEELTQICVDLDKKIAEVSQSVKENKQKEQKLKEIQVQHLSNIDIIDYDIETMKAELKDLEEQQERLKQKEKKQVKQLEIEKKSQVAKWNQELSKTQWRVSKAILQEKADLAVKRKEIEEWQNKINEKKYEISELKQQMVEVKENQMVLGQLKQKLRQTQKI